jgi:hypothetical protein
VTVENPERPSEAICEAFGDDDESVFADRCDQPATVDRDVGEELRRAAGECAGYGLIGAPVWWAIFALVLHGGTRIAGGTGSVRDSFAIAAWAITVEVLRLAAGVAVVWYALASTAVGGATIGAVTDEIVAVVAATRGPLLVASAVVVAMQWVVVVGGWRRITTSTERLPASAAACWEPSACCSRRCEGRPRFREFLARSGSLSRHDPVGRGYPRPPRGGGPGGRTAR